MDIANEISRFAQGEVIGFKGYRSTKSLLEDDKAVHLTLVSFADHSETEVQVVGYSSRSMSEEVQRWAMVVCPIDTIATLRGAFSIHVQIESDGIGVYV